jgi:hypothetical protein
MRTVPTAVRRLVAVVASLLTSTAAVTALQAPAAHAVTAPWQFTQVSGSLSIAASGIDAVEATCPAGFMAIGGGLSNFTGGVGTFEIVNEYPVGSQIWHVGVHNYDAVARTASINVVCALASQVGALTHVSTTLGRSSTTGVARGVVACGVNSVALFGAADWSGTGSTRRVDLFSPGTTGGGWFVSGWSPTAGDSLFIEAWCIGAGKLGVGVVQQFQTFQSAAAVQHQVTCSAGSRPTAGGVLVGATGGAPSPGFWGNDWYSAASATQPTWDTYTYVEAGSDVRWLVWCLPAGHPTIALTQTPPGLTNSASATFAYTLGDTAGEPASSVACTLDGNPVGCNASGAGLAGIGEGTHTFSVSVTNQSFQTTSQQYQWQVDQTPPQLVTPLASPSVNGPIVIGFTEGLAGLDGISVTQAGQATPLNGTLQYGASGAEFRPATPLLPGGMYDVHVTSAIHDAAGNSVTPAVVPVRADVVVDSASPLVKERWDRDTSASADGRGYLESNLAGATATWTVTTKADQVVSLRGVRRNTGGYGAVYLDGTKVKTASFYSSATKWQVAVYNSAPLAAGPHTVKLVVNGTKPTGSKGAWVLPDALVVGTSHAQETAALQQLRRVANASASGGSYDTTTFGTSGDTGDAPSYTLAFGGTGIRGYFTKAASAGSVVVYVDGLKKKTASLKSTAAAYNQLGFSVTGLAAGRHTLKLVPLGTTTGAGSTISLDRLTAL